MFFNLKQKKNIILLILLAVLILGALFFLFFFPRQQNNLSEYVPADAVFYVSLDLDSVNKFCLFDGYCFKKNNLDLFKEWLQQNPKRQKIIKDIVSQIKEKLPANINFEKEIFPLFTNESLLIGLNEDETIKLNIIIPIKDRQQINNLLDRFKKRSTSEKFVDYRGHKIVEINSRIKGINQLAYTFLNNKKDLLIADDEKNIKKIIDTKNGLTASLLGNKMNSAKRTGDIDYFHSKNVFLNGRLNLPLLKNYFFQLSNSPKIANVLIPLLSYPSDLKEIKFSGQVLKNKLVLTLGEKEDFWQWQPNKSENMDKFLSFTRSIPLLAKQNMRFAISGKNLAKTINNIMVELKNNNPSIDSYLEKFRVNTETIYQFDFRKDILPLFIKDTSLFVFTKKSLADGNEYRFVRNASDQYNHFFSLKNLRQTRHILILDKTNLDSLLKLENIIKQILAFKLPEEKEKILPDKTKITEFVADPDKFSFQREVLKQGNTIKFIKEPALDFEFGYTFLDDKIILSDSISLLEKFTDQIQRKKQMFDSLEFKEGAKMFYFSFDDVFRKSYGLNEIVANDQSNEDGLLVKLFVY